MQLKKLVSLQLRNLLYTSVNLFVNLTIYQRNTFSSPFTTYHPILAKTEQIIHDGCDQLHW